MADVQGIVQRAADRGNFRRDRYDAKKLPTDMSNIHVLPLFCDLRHTFIASSMLLKRYKEEVKASKYLILASWPGMAGLFPYVDEYWSPVDESFLAQFYSEAKGFDNESDLLTGYHRSLNQFFFDVADAKVLNEYYDNGFTSKYWDEYKVVKRSLPMVPSTGILNKDLARELTTRAGYKVFIYPSLWVRGWRYGQERVFHTPKEFWVALVKRLMAAKYVPVIQRHPWTHDISPDVPESCIHVNEMDMSKVLGIMRSVGCVLDVFSGVSRLALAARCPFVCIDERSRYSACHEMEVNDLCGQGVPRQYIFSFATILGGSSDGWEDSLFKGLLNRLESFLPELNRDSWPATSEVTDVVPYDAVRKKKIKKIGATFFKVPKE